jgi:hypothetical protein
MVRDITAGHACIVQAAEGAGVATQVVLDRTR